MIRAAVALLLTVPGGGAAVSGAAVTAPGAVAVAPSALAITTGQCNGRDLTVLLTNPGPEPIYADATLAAPPELHLPRSLISSWLPPGYTLRVPVAVTGTRAGSYPVTVVSNGHTIEVPVTVTPPAPDADLMRLAARVTASSARAGGSACAAIDGRADTMWNDTTGKRWPDWWRLDWASAHTISRVEVTTTADWGLRDWDVEVLPSSLSSPVWTIVASVRGNTATRNIARFAPSSATAVRIVTLAGNTVNDQSRLTEVVIR